MVKTYDPEPVWNKPPDVAEKWIQFVDDNVLASKFFYAVDPQSFDMPRITCWGEGQLYISVWRKLLDAYC